MLFGTFMGNAIGPYSIIWEAKKSHLSNFEKNRPADWKMAGTGSGSCDQFRKTEESAMDCSF